MCDAAMTLDDVVVGIWGVYTVIDIVYRWRSEGWILLFFRQVPESKLGFVVTSPRRKLDLRQTTECVINEDSVRIVLKGNDGKWINQGHALPRVREK